MIFSPTQIDGVRLIELELRQDDRGFLARTYCAEEFREAGLNTDWPQCNLTLTRGRGMLRGLHFQGDPRPEVKLIRCADGVVFDVLVDVRRGSPTYGQWESFELTAANRRQLYVPGGIAHGFQCLTDHCEVFYQMSEVFVPELARGLRWDDPEVAIPWPLPDPRMSERDRTLPGLRELS